jgi:hypothetical protein
LSFDALPESSLFWKASKCSRGPPEILTRLVFALKEIRATLESMQQAARDGVIINSTAGVTNNGSVSIRLVELPIGAHISEDGIIREFEPSARPSYREIGNVADTAASPDESAWQDLDNVDAAGSTDGLEPAEPPAS